MSRLDKATELLKQAEKGLGDLVREAVSNGDYDVAVLLTGHAKALANLVGSTSVDRRATPAKMSAVRTAPTRLTARSLVQKNRKTGGRRKGYPRFVTQRDNLIKIGWSKTRNAVYQHKAPWQVVALVAESMIRANANGSLIRFDDLMPLVDVIGNEVPAYQAYLALAWFRSEGLIEQEGRQGYKVQQTVFTRETVERRRSQLPER